MFMSRLATPLKSIFFMAILCALSGCESVNSGVGGILKLDTDLKMSLVVDADINPDEKDSPSPLFLRLYQLKSDTLFGKVDFLDLYEQDEEKLGADFISKQELKLVKPGESREERFVLNKDTKYIAIFAEFFQYKDANYKIIFPVTSNNIIRNAVKIHITSNDVKLLNK